MNLIGRSRALRANLREREKSERPWQSNRVKIESQTFRETFARKKRGHARLSLSPATSYRTRCAHETFRSTSACSRRGNPAR
ncbi:hypothetical protein PUN28_009659 [Cardiocondyla obscurior]|uniref:Uncharacterized protein n=1 Tax=Cardiocondyla obscurior TaxID=286306 RepID=A0AAW2FZ13_9HYME